ncbi:MAG: hypothetical protein ACRD1Y_09060 [Terriglobales bacterium]
MRHLPFRILIVAALAVLTLACHRQPAVPVWKLEFVSNPTPPVAGALTRFRCLLTTASGAPVDGAAALLTLVPQAAPHRSMPAGAALHIELAPRGNGIYAGTGTIRGAGTWEVTLTLSRRGRIQLRRYPLTVAAPAPAS